MLREKNFSKERMNRKAKSSTDGLKINNNLTAMNMMGSLIRGRSPQLHHIGNMILRPQPRQNLISNARNIFLRVGKRFLKRPEANLLLRRFGSSLAGIFESLSWNGLIRDRSLFIHFLPPNL